MLNVPVNDVLALRGAIATSKHDGYLRSTQGFSKDYDDDDSLSARLHALFKFTPDLTLLLSADSTKLRGAGPGNVPYPTFISKTGDAQRTASPSILGFINDTAHGASAELKAKTRVGDLTYQFARRTLDRDDDQPLGQEQPNVINIDYRTLAYYSQNSHELRLASSFGNWRTIAGLYWFREQSRIDARFRHYPNLGELAFVQNPTISQSKAAFGEATYSVTPDLHLIAGLRRTFDDKSRKGGAEFGNPVVSRTVNDAAVSYAQTTGRVGADYALSKQTMIYATFSTGYKAGGFNDGTVATNRFLKYDPEHLSSLEAGVKGRFLDNRLQLNGDIFKYNYKNLQLSGVVLDPVTGASSSQTRNAAKASVTGAELEGKYAVGSSGKITFSATWLDAHFKSYQPRQNVDWAGRRLEKSPRATFSLGYSHAWDFENGGSLTGYVGTRYSSSYVINDNSNALQFAQGGFHKSDVNLNYTPAGFKWSLQAFVRNIEDKTVMTAYGGPSGNRPATAALAPPRTMGVRLVVNL
jgi:iron complex outermembrane receptor protein